ncbi:hypothetical protein EYB25_001419 [Talaromyces marneffei]|nr:hypothetical protein EYB25_001419 [Talaromyces marneffei]
MKHQVTTTRTSITKLNPEPAKLVALALMMDSGFNSGVIRVMLARRPLRNKNCATPSDNAILNSGGNVMMTNQTVVLRNLARADNTNEGAGFEDDQVHQERSFHGKVMKYSSLKKLGYVRCQLAVTFTIRHLRWNEIHRL